MTKPVLSLYYSEKEGDGRRYRHPLTGEYLVSVTTVLKEEAKESLIGWAVSLTLKWCIENWMSLGQMSDEKALNRGRYRWKDVRDERAEVGDGVHSTIEAMHTGSWDYPQLDPEQQRIMEQFADLNTVHKIEPVYTELTVWQKGMYAGTLDGIWIIDGELCLIDVKTSKSHWPAHDYQLSALANAETALVPLVANPDPKNPEHWEEIDNPGHISKIDAVKIIHLREDKWAIIDVPHIPENYEIFKGYVVVVHGKEKLKEVQKND